jgi:hypothetical protein
MLKLVIKNFYEFGNRLGVHLKSAGYMLDNEAMTRGYGWECMRQLRTPLQLLGGMKLW